MIGKTITISSDNGKFLSELKLHLGLKTLDEAINKLIIIYKGVKN